MMLKNIMTTVDQADHVRVLNKNDIVRRLP